MSKTLVELYQVELDKQPEANPALSDIMFFVAFPGATPKKKAKELTRLSEDLFEDFNEAWKNRIEEGILQCLNEDMEPPIILNTVPFLTKTEATTLLQKIDEFLPGDTDEMLAMRVAELQNQYNNFAITATEILRQHYAAYMQKKSTPPLIQPAGGLVDPLGLPLS